MTGILGAVMTGADNPDGRESKGASRAASSLRGARALVTGATGFLGRHLCSRLRSEGAHVVGVSRHPQESVDADVQHEVDLSIESAARGLVEEVRPELVFHLAGWVRGAREAEHVLPALHANLLSTVHLLVATSAWGGCRRFVQAGSLEEAVPESPAAAPSSPYAASKMAATAYCRMYAELYGLPVTLARIFMVYGPNRSFLLYFVTMYCSRDQYDSGVCDYSGIGSISFPGV
ncbi:MAG: NAD-dependent epimerase/dehydratase family protein [Pseudomonadota bacterium]